LESAQDLAGGMAREDSEQFRIDARDFLSARGTTGTRIDQQTAALCTLLLARLLPQLTQNGNTVEDASEALRDIGDGEG
jgi:hypothetical protein